MGPELTCSSNTDFGFIDYERNALLLSKASNLSVEIRRCQLIIESVYWFDNDSSYVPLTVPSLFDNIQESFNASVLFSSVLMLKLSHGVSHPWERSDRPIKSRNLLQIHLRIAA